MLEDIVDMAVLAETEHSETKAKFWIEIGKIFETNGVPSYKIPMKIITQIHYKLHKIEGYEDAQINNGHFYRVMKTQFWGTKLKESDQNPPKGDGDSSINTKNIDLLKFIQDLRECGRIIEQSVKGTAIQLDEWSKDLIRDLEQSLKIIRDTMDDKQKIPPNTHTIFKAILAEHVGIYSIAKAYQLTRYEHISQINAWLTNKQLKKFENGGEPNILEIFKPKSRDMAVFMGWYGIQCKCGSWRVESLYNDKHEIKCHDCDNVFEGKSATHCKYCQVPLYNEDIKIILEQSKIKKGSKQKTGNCPSCGTELRVPEDYS